MSSGTQVDLDWAGIDTAAGGTNVGTGNAPVTPADVKYLTDEEILGMEPASPDGGYGGPASEGRTGFSLSHSASGRQATDPNSKSSEPDLSSARLPDGEAQPAPGENRQAEACPTGAMPAWMAAAAADPRHATEAQQLWREHQEFRAAFASPDEARAVKELLPGGVRDVLSLREATQSVERIDAAIFSGDARAQAEVVSELARANPAAFRSMFAEAAKVLAELGNGRTGFSLSRSGNGHEAGSGDAGSQKTGKDAVGRLFRGGEVSSGRTEGHGSKDPGYSSSEASARSSKIETSHESQLTDHGPQDTNHPSPELRASPSSVPNGLRASDSENFDPAAYATFERATNDAVARDVRGSIQDTLERVMPEGVAEGAARRIGEDIFHEVHRALAADRSLSEQVAGVLSARRFGGDEQQRVASLLAGRARQIVPSVARRVIGEWTSTVLSTAHNKAARQAAAASRVDIAAPGGSRDSMPLRSRSAGSQRAVNYASTSDEEILGM